MKKKILVVDDNRLLRKFLTTHLERAGHQVRAAEDGFAALDVLADFAPDVMFVDLFMPKIDGDRLCHGHVANLNGDRFLRDPDTTLRGGDQLLILPIDGAVHRVGQAETAWSCRNATWSMVIAGIDPNPAKAESMKTWAKNYWNAVHPFTMGGAYINFMMEEGEERVQATYGDNYQRLVEIKDKYDPSNLFRVNQNIRPRA